MRLTQTGSISGGALGNFKPTSIWNLRRGLFFKYLLGLINIKIKIEAKQGHQQKYF